MGCTDVSNNAAVTVALAWMTACPDDTTLVVFRARSAETRIPAAGVPARRPLTAEGLIRIHLAYTCIDGPTLLPTEVA